MGKGSIQRKSYLAKRGYFCVKDCDTKSGDTNWFVVEPLISADGKRFFYVKSLSGTNNKYEITGEGYIKKTQEHVAMHLSELRKELAGVAVYYFFIDDEGRIYQEKTLSRRTHAAKWRY